MTDESTEVQALYAMEKIVEEAADKRWPVDAETVEEAIELFDELIESDTPISTPYLKETRDDLEKVHHLVDGAPKRSVDHGAVQDLVWEYEQELLDHDFLN